MPKPYRVEDNVYDLNVSFYVELTEADLPEDVWVRGAELWVGDNTITHHMCVWIYPRANRCGPTGAALRTGAPLRARAPRPM